jgi:3'(2'), 5'-bisphosphate nucleotidase
MTIDANFLDNLSNDLKRIVSDASEAIMGVYEKNTFDTEIKSDGSPVTEADESANKIIIQSLNIISPDISIVSEETYDKSDEIPNEPYWLVDPLDGTKEFINKSKDFTVNIALIKESKPCLWDYMRSCYRSNLVRIMFSKIFTKRRCCFHSSYCDE